MKIHFIGIKGSGMASLASICKDLGYEVDGSDKSIYIFTEKVLKEKEIEYFDFSLIDYNKYDMFVAGHDYINSAFANQARSLNKKVVEYHECLASIASLFTSIAVSGSHGKTTTCKMIEQMMNQSVKTSYLIGDGEGKYICDSSYFVLEACEYKRHFLKYQVDTHMILNVDLDHVDYYKTLEDYQKAFYEFASSSKRNLVINGDDDYLNRLNIPNIKIIRFGLKEHNDVRATNISDGEDGVSYDLWMDGKYIKRVSMNKSGLFLVYNSLCALSLTKLYPLDLIKSIENLKVLKSVNRRFVETIVNDEIYIDDYAHHFNEIKMTISTCRNRYKERKIIAIFRPDRHSRILRFVEEFKHALNDADYAYVVNFPPTSINDTIQEFDAKILCDEKKIKFFDESAKAYEELAKFHKVVYLFMSSKDLSKISFKLREKAW